MNSDPNLFESLFDFHPRELHTPKENFLTESFAYLLRTDDAVLNGWLSMLLEKETKGAICNIKTRQTEKDLDVDTSIYPDLLIEGQLSDGQEFAVYCEHKWNSEFNEKQLRRYRKVTERKGRHARLAFVGANFRQKSDALNCFQDNCCSCFLWEDVFRTLDRIREKSSILKEFLTFMKNQGLSPGEPITIERMKAFLQTSDFVGSLLNLANKLNTGYAVEANVPTRFHEYRQVHDAYGRVGIRFATKEWKPFLSFGFLYDVRDHRVALVNPDRGIDLLLRIEADPVYTKSIQPALDVLKEKRKTLLDTAASVLLKGDRGNGNNWSVVIIRDCLGDVIEDVKSEADQLAVIHKKISTWLKVLFEDGMLENAFKRSGLDSGMK
jgi:hypothetical protein